MGFLDSVGNIASSAFNLATGNVGSAAISLVGGLLGNHSAAKQAQASRDQSIDVAKHAHQWEVKDLKKAGLNPILSAGGSGATVSSLPVAGQMNPFAGVGDTLNSSRKIDEVDKKALEIQNRLADSQIDLQDATEGAQDALKNKLASDKVLADEQAALTRMNSVNTIMERANIAKRGQVLDSEADRNYSASLTNSAYAAKTDAERALTEREQRAGKYEEKTQKYTRPVRDVIDTITSPIRGLFHGVKHY